MFQPGQQIGSYTLLHRLGKGGFGEVWLAEKRSQLVTKKVAVKLPHEDQINIEAIRQEAALWEQASGHANVLPIIDADVINGQVLIVSEYADGGSLQDKLKREGKLPLQKAVEMTIGILNGLEFLHNKRIIHRDIKPQNILLQGETPRLADFGISRAMQTTVVSSTIIGTDAYMSPESFDGKRTVQTDIWAVGVVLYQLLAAALPFPQEHASERMFAIFSKEFAPLGNDIPGDLRQIVGRALAKQPENRYQTTTEMRDALQKALLHIAHPTFAPTEPFRIPLEHLPPISSIINNPQTDPIEKETVVRNLQSHVTPPLTFQNESIQTQFKPVHFTENKPSRAEMPMFADISSDSSSMPLPYQLAIGACLGVTGLVIMIAVFTFVIEPLTSSQPNTAPNISIISPPAAALMNIEVRVLDDSLVFYIVADGKSQPIGGKAPLDLNFTAQNNFTMGYDVLFADRFRVKINGKVIPLPKTAPSNSSSGRFEVTKDNLDQILRNGSNENLASKTNVNSSMTAPTPSDNLNQGLQNNSNKTLSNSPLTSPSTSEMTIQISTTAVVFFNYVIDGKDDITYVPNSWKRFHPKQSLKFKYSKVFADNVEMTINDQTIALPKADQAKGNSIQFEITKDTLSEILQRGKVTQSAANR